MAVDNLSAQGCRPAFALLRQILDSADTQWVHEQAGDDRRLLRQFRAQRRRSFYSCIGAIRDEARQLRSRWVEASDRLQDFGGFDWPMEQAKLNLRLGWVCLVAECHFRVGVNLSEALRSNLLGHLDRAADFTLAARVSN
jgi:hypothetical protein